MFTRWRLAVFVDDAFWHAHPDCCSLESGEHEDDVAQTSAQDIELGLALSKAEFKVLRFWDYEISQDLAECVREVERALAIAGRPRGR